jgi:hypothetical protein
MDGWEKRKAKGNVTILECHLRCYSTTTVAY